MIGRTISHYEIVEKIGEGGMGEVYKARDTSLHRFVAIKALPPDKTADPERKARFAQEARAASALNHPNIVAIHDMLSDDGREFIVMEYVSGKTLAEKIADHELRLHDILKLATQTAEALGAAHSAGIVHRDLKPANVIVSDAGQVKVLDFGLAKLAGASPMAEAATVTQARTGPGTVLGTVGYMSPEQVRGDAVDHRSDIFNLGLVLYEMLAGKRAFTGRSSMDVMSAILKEPTPELPENIPGGLRELVADCLEKEPARRFESARDLAFALRALSGGSAASVAAPTIEAPPKQRKWTIRAGIGALAAAALVFAALYLVRPDPPDASGYKLIPFATALSTQGCPAWSPDGKSIAYSGAAEGTNTVAETQLYVQRLDSPTPLQITKPPMGSVQCPAWGPDSRELYFRALRGGPDGGIGLWKTSAVGGDPALAQRRAVRGSVSPDGRTLAFLSRQTDVPSPSFGVWIASPPDGTPHPYEPAPFKAGTAVSQPVIHFAPDGRKILVAANPDGRGHQIWLLPWPPGAPRRILTDVPLFGRTPQFSWMPDSRQVVFSAKPDLAQPATLFMGDVETGRFRPLMAAEREMVAVAASPDGGRLVYTSDLSQYDVLEVPLDGKPVKTLIGSFRNEGMPSYSPVARTLVYVTDRRGAQEVWTDSLGERRSSPLLSASDFRLPSGPVFWFATPVFSPDAQRIAVAAFNESGAHLWITGVAGSAPVRATTEEANEYGPTWSPDGLWLAYLKESQGRRTLAKIRIGAPPSNDLLPNVVNAASPEWSPTGEWIACVVAGKPGITLVSPDGKNTRYLPGAYGPVAWSRDGKTIYQVHGANDCSVVATEVAGGKERVIRELDGDLRPATWINPGLRITVAPDGKSLAWSVNRARSELWILEGLHTPRPWYARLLRLR